MFGKKILTLSAFTFMISACGGGSDSSSTVTAPSTSIGVFEDSVVAGLQYTTSTLSGITNANGEYEYIPGETVSFSIGGIEFGSALAQPLITPLSLVNGAADATDPAVTNIVRLLLTLDSDLNPDNGIKISSATITAAENLTVDFTTTSLASDPGVIALLPQLANSPTLVDAQTAQTHFTATLQKNSTWGSMAWGSGTWQSKAP